MKRLYLVFLLPFLGIVFSAVVLNATDKVEMKVSGNVWFRVTSAGDLVAPALTSCLFLYTDSSGTFHCGTYTPVKSTGSAGYLAKFIDATTIGNSIIYETGGKIGIGTTSPFSKLFVSGGKIRIHSTDKGGGQLQIGNPNDDEASLGFFTDVAADWSSYSHGWVIGPDVWGIGTGKFGIGSYGGPYNVKLTIEESTGNVGIGTTSPAYKLDVSGDARVTGTLYANTRVVVNSKCISIPANTEKWIRVAESTSNAARQAGLFVARWSVGGQHGHVIFYAGADYGADYGIRLTIIGADRFGDQGVDKIRILENRTYDPMYLELYVDNNNANYAMTVCVDQLYRGYNGWNLIDITDGGVPAGYTSHEIDANTAFAVNENSKIFTVEENGNVGIGTASPADKLHVKGWLRIEDTDTSDYVKISTDGWAHFVTTKNVIDFQPQNINYEEGVRIYVDGNGKGAIRVDGDAILAAEAGKVGIGTTSPDSKLHIIGGVCIESSDSGCSQSAGNLKVSGTATVGDLSCSNCVALGSETSGVLPLAEGGTGSSLSDPNDDRILFWDDSASKVTWLDVGGGLAISGTTISHADTSSQSSVDNSGGTVIQDITLDTYGHVTGINSANLDNRYTRGSGTSGYIAKWTGSKTLGNSIIYDIGTGVGIGITKPKSILHIYKEGEPNSTVGSAPASLRIEGGGSYNWESGEAASELLFMKDGDIVAAIRAEHDRPGGEHSYEDAGLTFYTGSVAETPTLTPVLHICSGYCDYNVGIGTTSPVKKLHVKGGVRIEDADSADYLDIYTNAAVHIYTTKSHFSFQPAGIGYAYGMYVQKDADGYASLLVPGETYLAKHSGKVVIGENNPDSKTEIYGMLVVKNANARIENGRLKIEVQPLDWNAIEVCQYGTCCPPWEDCDGDGYTYLQKKDCDEGCANCYVGNTNLPSRPDGKDNDCDGQVDEEESTSGWYSLYGTTSGKSCSQKCQEVCGGTCEKIKSSLTGEEGKYDRSMCEPEMQTCTTNTISGNCDTKLYADPCGDVYCRDTAKCYCNCPSKYG